MAIDVFMILPRNPTLPEKDEVHDANLDKEAGYVVELKSYHFGFQRAGTGSAASGGHRASQIQANPLVVTKQVDLASASLMTTLHKNLLLPQVKLVVRKSGATEPYLCYTLEDAIVASLVWATSNADDVAEEHLSLAYGGLKLEYRAQDQAGALQPPVTASWNGSKPA